MMLKAITFMDVPKTATKTISTYIERRLFLGVTGTVMIAQGIFAITDIVVYSGKAWLGNWVTDSNEMAMPTAILFILAGLDFLISSLTDHMWGCKCLECDKDC